MHTEYRILNIVLSLEDNKPCVLCDIATFSVDKEKGINEFTGLFKQITAKYPYTQELLVKKNTEVVILDDLQFKGDLKLLIKKNKHLVLSEMDYQYKDYVYLICQLPDNNYLVYSEKNQQEIVSFSTLRMYDDMGRLFNAMIKEKQLKTKVKQIVVCGTNINDEKKRMTPVEVRELKDGSLVVGKHGQFALDMVKLKSNKIVKSISIKSGQLDTLNVHTGSVEGSVDFKLPDSVKNLLTSGRKYVFQGTFGELDLSSLHLITKNAVLLKADIDKLILDDDAARSSNLDFLVYSLGMYTGVREYRVKELVIENVNGEETLDLVIKLLAELYFNTETYTEELQDSCLWKIGFEGSYVVGLEHSGNYDRWIEQGLTRFSMILLENYMKAVSYYKKALKKEGKNRNELSLQTLDMLSEYEDSLLEECNFFNYAKYILTGKSESQVYNTISKLIEQNQYERVSTANSSLAKDILINDFLSNLK